MFFQSINYGITHYRGKFQEFIDKEIKINT